MFLNSLFVLSFVLLSNPALADWPQWAGPDRDFRVQVDSKITIPDGGLEKLWSVDLGLGYSSVSAVGDRLFTMDREGDIERVVCLSAENGETLWAYAYDAPHSEKMRLGYGTGPHGTPLVHDGRVFTIGATGKMNVLSAKDGAVLWQKDLWTDLGGTFLVRGYASSPVAFKDTVIIILGGESQGLMAFDAASGEEQWRGPTLLASQSSPILADVGEETSDLVLVAFANDEVIAVDPTDGKELWRIAHKSGAAYNISTPIYDQDTKRLFVSSAYGGGTRGLKISRQSAEELWHTNRLKVHYTNMLFKDDHLYGTTGNAGTVILAALDTATGKVLWKDRKIVRSQMLSLAGSQALALTEDGDLFLLGLRPQGATIEAQMQIGEEKSWTLPTMVGDRIFIRTEGSAMAFALPDV